MSVTLSDFDYQLPQERIARYPAEPRDHSRLMVINRATGEIAHDVFYNLGTYLQPGDVLVRNNTKVLPARLTGTKNTGGSVEVLLIKKIPSTTQAKSGETWECLTKPGLKEGQSVQFSPTLSGVCTGAVPDNYSRAITFTLSDAALLAEVTAIGSMPLPHYIDTSGTSEESLKTSYQTTYAKHLGSAAAPTAGLHFTPQLDENLRARGIHIAEVTLHVGLGTFLPVKSENITEHHMHSERFELPATTAKLIQDAKKSGSRVVAVGTTSNRVIESCSSLQKDGSSTITPQVNDTDIYIYPPYRFICTDALITNFHLPKSTLLMLVSAFASHPNSEAVFTNFSESLIGAAYKEAIKNEYRFYSFGDAMIVL